MGGWMAGDDAEGGCTQRVMMMIDARREEVGKLPASASAFAGGRTRERRGKRKGARKKDRVGECMTGSKD